MQHEKFQIWTLKIITTLWHSKKIPITLQQGCTHIDGLVRERRCSDALAKGEIMLFAKSLPNNHNIFQ